MMILDGLNAGAITDPGHLDPFLDELRKGLSAAGYILPRGPGAERVRYAAAGKGP